MQVDHITTMAFHPQANGMVEQMHCQLKDTLHARDAASTWADHLPWVILGLCAAPKDESGVSALEASLGQSLVIPGQPKAPEGAVPATLHAPTRFLLPLWIWQSGSTCGEAQLGRPCRQVGEPLPCAVPRAEVLQAQDGGEGGHRQQRSTQASQGSRRSIYSRPTWPWAPPAWLLLTRLVILINVPGGLLYSGNAEETFLVNLPVVYNIL